MLITRPRHRVGTVWAQCGHSVDTVWALCGPPWTIDFHLICRTGGIATLSTNPVSISNVALTKLNLVPFLSRGTGVNCKTIPRLMMMVMMVMMTMMVMMVMMVGKVPNLVWC